MPHGTPHTRDDPLEYGDAITKQDEDTRVCEPVDHEPITVAGPQNASAPRVDYQFRDSETEGGLARADYEYKQKLELESDDCIIEVCDGDEPPTEFQTRHAPLKLGFSAYPKEPDEPPLPCRLVYLGRGFRSGNISYGSSIPFGSFGGSRCRHLAKDDGKMFSTDVEGAAWEFSWDFISPPDPGIFPCGEILCTIPLDAEAFARTTLLRLGENISCFTLRNAFGSGFAATAYEEFVRLRAHDSLCQGSPGPPDNCRRDTVTNGFLCSPFDGICRQVGLGFFPCGGGPDDPSTEADYLMVGRLNIEPFCFLKVRCPFSVTQGTFEEIGDCSCCANLKSCI